MVILETEIISYIFAWTTGKAEGSRVLVCKGQGKDLNAKDAKGKRKGRKGKQISYATELRRRSLRREPYREARWSGSYAPASGTGLRPVRRGEKRQLHP